MKKFNIILVKKNDLWLFKKEQQLIVIEKYGYIFLKILGEGVYVKVKFVDFKKYNKKVVVKMINKRRVFKDFFKKFLFREVYLMYRFNYLNVVREVLFQLRFDDKVKRFYIYF